MSAFIACLFFLLTSGLTSAISDDGIYFGTQTLLLTDKDPMPKKCVYNTVYKILQATCANLNSPQIPPTLRKDIQALDFSTNRLRDLKNDTLSSFTSLSFLYLTDNFITSIEDAAFINLRSLQVLDLATNGLNDIPKNIFALPVIKKLYLSDNKIIDKAMDPTSFTGESSLEYLDISKNQLTKIPRLRILPHLTELNVSRNFITIIKTEDLATFCSLRILDVSNNPIILTDSCECQALNAWVTTQKIKVIPSKFNCTNEQSSKEMSTPWCARQHVNNLVSNETLRIFESCKNVLKLQEQTVKARSTWIVVVSCIAGFLACLFIILYCIHRRNKNKKSVSVKRDLVTNHADDELLKGTNVTERVE